MSLNTRKLVVLFTLILCLTSLTVASAQDEVINLTMTALAGPAGDGVQAAIDDWNVANPNIQVTIEMQADEINWQATAPSTMFSSDDGPDLSWWWCSPSFQYKDMIAADLLAPLNDLYESQDWENSYPAGTIQYFTEPDGNRYGVNVDVVWTPYVFYNKEIFAELGLEPPTTWEELYAIGQAVREAGYQPLVTMYDYGLVNHLPDGLMMRSWTQDEYNALLQNWSPDVPEELLQYKWTDPNGVRIFQTLRDMVDNGFFADGFAGMTDYDAAKSLFTSGNAAMYQMGSWEGGAAAIESAVDFEFDYFYYPQMDQEPYGVVGSWIPNCFIAFQNRPNVDAAKQVIAYLASPEGITTYYRSANTTPGRTDLPQEVVDELLNPMTARMLADVGELGAPSLFEGAVPPTILATLKQACDLVLVGSITPEEAAQMMQDAYEDYREG